jgi:hypothetical protein
MALAADRTGADVFRAEDRAVEIAAYWLAYVDGALLNQMSLRAASMRGLVRCLLERSSEPS